MAGNDRLLSICCLGYRHAPFIRDCISSIWQDDWPEKEIIAMDDGSGDGSVEVLQELASQSPCPFTVLEQDNTGNVPANFNKLFKSSRGRFVLFTSLDDMQLNGAITARMERLLADDSCAFAAHTQGLALKGDRMAPERTPLSGLQPSAADILAMERSQLHSFYIQGAVFRREPLEAVGCFSENMLGDDIVLRTKILLWIQANSGKHFALIDEPGFIYRRHDGNLSRNTLRQLKLVCQYYERFWPGKPYPPMLKQWLLGGLDLEPWNKILEVFAQTPQMSAFLLDPEVQRSLRLNAVRDYVGEQRAQEREKTQDAV